MDRSELPEPEGDLRDATRRFARLDRRSAGSALLWAGLIWLAILAFAAAWPDMEASVFDESAALVADDRLRGLRCPWLITPSDEAAIRLSLHNQGDRPAAFELRSRISEGFLTVVREDRQQLRLAPGERRDLSWPISSEDAAYDRFVLVRVLVGRSSMGPARQQACGVLVLDMPGLRRLPGRWIAFAGLVLGLASSALGAIFWLRTRSPLGSKQMAAARRAGVLAALVLASLVTGLAGAWLPSHLLLIASALLGFVLLEEAFGSGL